MPKQKKTIPFDLTPIWLDSLEKHIFSSDEITTVSLGDKRHHDDWQYRYRKDNQFGWLNSKAILPIANYYTTYNYPLYFDAGVKGYNVWFRQLKKLRWDFLDIGPLPEKSSQLVDVISAIGNEDLSFETFHQHTNWYLQLNNRSFEQYFESLPKKLQNTIKRKGRKLEREPSAEIVIFSGLEANKRIGDFHTVYKNSWKPEESHPTFITEIIEKFSGIGWTRLGFVYIDKQPIATQFWVVKGGIAYIYKLSYVEGFEKFSAGTILTAAMMDHVISDDKVTKVDFLTGNDAYKRDWMSHSRELLGVRIYNNSFKGLLLSSIEKLKRLLKNRLVTTKRA